MAKLSVKEMMENAMRPHTFTPDYDSPVWSCSLCGNQIGDTVHQHWPDSPPVSTDEPDFDQMAGLAAAFVGAGVGAYPKADSRPTKCGYCGKREVGHKCHLPTIEEMSGLLAPEPALSLLIIDLGDECLVQVEKGIMPHTSSDPIKDLGFYGKRSIVRASFDKLRSALDALGDGEKPPVPRMEQVEGSGPFRYRLFPGTDGFDGFEGLTVDQYNALCQLAGVTIPVWQPKPRGVWKRIWPINSEMPLASPPFNAWRFTVTEGGE